MADEMLKPTAEIQLTILRDNIFCGQLQEKVQKVISFDTSFYESLQIMRNDAAALHKNLMAA
jgi:hypothetical protein